ncbi:tryptophan synthase subunit alpha [Campylobacter porcelli]|uniref:Tryptophan synthase alpha chain n=1 Tax=Campylobacter porcelli TaxID=1660073 RepID=A0A1X9SVM0_9BACT|nr:tryptophan synthase subunit alpha [Campylobacter sp. RM6137]ARR00226.1 tryptophan synthase, alpha subunit [Campylobacter sp. RM6137]
MDKIQKAFNDKKANIGYIVAGYPNLEYTKEFLNLLDESCLDILEIGIPYSDPLADGKLIANAAFEACQNGVTTNSVFDILKEIKTKKALVFLVYYNIILSYGEDRFLQDSKECGISGILVPDMPYEESKEFASKCQKHGISLIRLIAPTSANRSKEIASNADGFIYAVGSLGVTGGEQSSIDRLKDMIKSIKDSSKLPVAIGFGVKNSQDVKAIKEYADGAIIGTKIVEITSKFDPQTAHKKIKELFE